MYTILKATSTVGTRRMANDPRFYARFMEDVRMRGVAGELDYFIANRNIL